jgi:opacity protein-like surface antigen
LHKLVAILAIVLGLCGSTSTFGQDVPRVDVFGGYSYLSADTNGLTSSRQNANGWEASVSGNFNRWLAVEGDFSGYYKTYHFNVTGFGLGIQNVNVNDFALIGGPHVNIRPAFFHALVGFDSLTGSAGGPSASQNSFAVALGGGVQIRVAPRWAVRGSADYILTRHNLTFIPGSSFTQNNFRVSAGVVFSFGGARENRSHVSGPSPRPPASGSEEAVLLGITGYTRDGSVAVTAVRPSSPAAGAGIEAGDVIMMIDGQPVHSIRDLETAAGTSTTGTVRVSYFKSGVLQTETNVKVR